jgi:hypothetical protein
MTEDDQPRRKQGHAGLADHFIGLVSEQVLRTLPERLDPAFEVAGDDTLRWFHTYASVLASLGCSAKLEHVRHPSCAWSLRMRRGRRL